MKFNVASAVLGLSLLFNCASTEVVVSEFDESVNFETYSSFVLCVEDLLVEYENNPGYDNPEVRELIGEEIEKQMIKRGHKLDVMNAELQAGFKLILEKNEVTFENCNSYGEYEYWDETTIETFVYTEETLVLYVSDMTKNQVIWQASIMCDLNISKKRLPEYIMEVVDLVFNEYPRVVHENL